MLNLIAIKKVFEKMFFHLLSQSLKYNYILSKFEFDLKQTTSYYVFSASDSGNLTVAVCIVHTKAFHPNGSLSSSDKLCAVGLSQHALLCFFSCVVVQGCKSCANSAIRCVEKDC